MAKIMWKPGTMLYPAPAVLVTSKLGKTENILTVSWTGTVCTNPPMVSISLRPERYSYDLIKSSGEFAINVPSDDLCFAVDFCGVKSGREIDKFQALKLIKSRASVINAPIIKNCPLSIECRVKSITDLGSHHLFLAEVVALDVEESLIDKKGKFRLEHTRLLCYNHGHYCATSKPLGKFGFSVQRKKR